MMRGNPLAVRRDRTWLKKYYLAAAEFWLEAVALQEQRCRGKHDGSRDFVADICFYVVAVQRLREIAAQAQKRLHLTAEATGLQAFDARWPNFRHLRDVLEHLLPTRSAPNHGDFGVTFFSDAIADLKPGGHVEYLLELRDMGKSVRQLNISLQAALSAESASTSPL